ncbi:electron transfer flavoprotein beta subunit [Desulfitispora alkaliphila]|uniref:electron transfer flavoprotein subunit beta/FixA family protein n=1 Tax=Desulfitispora alkaliphila TaxID=622674 RepID=UPI003D2157A0
MHIVVCIKQVPDTTEVRVDPKTNTLVREGVPSIVNPYDIHGVEEAVRLRDKYGGKVTIISLGPPQAEEALRRAIAFGSDEAILITDRSFAGSDTLATSYVITQAIKKIQEKEPIDLIICGKQAIDGDTAQVGPGIAVRLGIPQLTYVMEIKGVNLEEEEITVARKLEGSQEVVAAKMPALLTVLKDINELSYSSLPNLIKSARYKPKRWTSDDLEIDGEKIGLKGSPTTVRKIFPPPEPEQGEILGNSESDIQEVASKLVNKLLKTKIIADR